MISDLNAKFPSRRRLLIATLALIALFALAVLAWRLLRPADDAWERLQRGGALRVAVDPSFPPFDDIGEDGQLVGFDIDLARELARRLGVPVEFKAIAFDGLVDAIIADKADVVISAFPLDPRLTEDVRTSQPYFEGGLVLVTRADNTVVGPEDLVGRSVAVEWGSLGDAWARSHGLDIPVPPPPTSPRNLGEALLPPAGGGTEGGLAGGGTEGGLAGGGTEGGLAGGGTEEGASERLLRQETADDALNAVAIGEADAALVDAVTAALSSAPGLLIHTPPLESDPYVIVLSRQAPKLAEVVDDALAEIMADGTWARLVQMHFTLTPPAPSGEE